jgi:tetratricopeptide (TPR) repeat protein
MDYKYDYYISYALEDNNDGFVDEFARRLRNSYKLKKLFGAKPRVFYDLGPIRGKADWEISIHTEIDPSRFMLVLLSPNYFRSERCAYELVRWLAKTSRQSLPDEGITLVYLNDFPEQFNDKTTNVPLDLLERFPEWLPGLNGRGITKDFDLSRRTKTSIGKAISALYDAGLDAQGVGARPKGAKSAADLQDDADAECKLIVSNDPAEKNGNIRKSIESCEKLIETRKRKLERNPNDVDALNELAALYNQLGSLAMDKRKYRPAKKYFEQAL